LPFVSDEEKSFTNYWDLVDVDGALVIHLLERALLALVFINVLTFATDQHALKKSKQLFEHQHLLLLRDTGGQSYNLNLNVVHFFNTSVN
jgi:hypothetical protein